jgi:hypothetical protein
MRVTMTFNAWMRFQEQRFDFDEFTVLEDEPDS